MNDDHLETYIEPELEARIVALVLGEASAFEREELERLMEEQAEVKLFHDRIAKLHDLLRGDAESKEDSDWTLPKERRSQLMETFAGTEESKGDQPRQKRDNSRRKMIGIRVLAAVAIVTTLAVPLVATFFSIQPKAGGNADYAVLARDERRSKELRRYSDSYDAAESPDQTSFSVADKFGALYDFDAEEVTNSAVTTAKPAEEMGVPSEKSDDLFARHFLGGADDLGEFDYRKARTDSWFGNTRADRDGDEAKNGAMEEDGFGFAGQSMPNQAEEESGGRDFGRKSNSWWMDSGAESSVKNRELRWGGIGLEDKPAPGVPSGPAKQSGGVAIAGRVLGVEDHKRVSGDRPVDFSKDLGGAVKGATGTFSELARTEAARGLQRDDVLDLTAREDQLRIRIKGNNRTKDSVVRRDIPGEDREAGDVNGETPEFESEPERDLLAIVTDKPTGAINFGDGVSRLDNLSLFAELSEEEASSPEDGGIRFSNREGEELSKRPLSFSGNQSTTSREFGLMKMRADLEVDDTESGKKSGQIETRVKKAKPVVSSSAFSSFAMPDAPQIELESITGVAGGMAGGGVALGVQKGDEAIVSDLDRPVPAATYESSAKVRAGGSVALPLDQVGLEEGRITADQSRGFGWEEKENLNLDGVERTQRMKEVPIARSPQGNNSATASVGGVVRATGESRQNGRTFFSQRGRPSSDGTQKGEGQAQSGKEQLAQAGKPIRGAQIDAKKSADEESDMLALESLHEEIQDRPELRAIREQLEKAQKSIEVAESQVVEREGEVAAVEAHAAEVKQLSNQLAALRRDQVVASARDNFQSTIAKTHEDYGFVLLNGGRNQGVAENSQLDIYRKGKLVGKLLVTSVEENQTVADIIPGSVQKGFSIVPGDTVVKSASSALPQSEPDQALIAREIDASNNPFSTFSLHVSDVSFKLAHASLMKDKWPDQDRIRIEEFVNAIDYDDPLPTSDERVAASVEQAIHPTMQQRNVLRIALRTAAAGRNSGTPLSLTFLLDSSGSMERFDRQETLQQAFSLLASQLNQHDKVTLISFARQPRLVAEAIAGNRCAELVELVSQLPEEGGTNLEAALHLAFEKAKQHHGETSQNRIILLTDGAANLGDANPERLSGMVQSMRDAGIAFDAAGIGAEGLNDEILEALTRKGDGRYYLLDRPEDADASFAKQIAGALRPAAGNVKVQVEFNPERVGKYQLHGFEKHRLKKEDFRNDKVDAAELAAAEAGVALYQVEILPEGKGDIGQVSVRFRDMQSGRMVEKRWPIPYQASLPHVLNGSESIRLATAATLVASKLKGEPLGNLSQWDELAAIVGSLSPQTQKRERIAQLSEMITRAGAISGK